MYIFDIVLWEEYDHDHKRKIKWDKNHCNKNANYAKLFHNVSEFTTQQCIFKKNIQMGSSWFNEIHNFTICHNNAFNTTTAIIFVNHGITSQSWWQPWDFKVCAPPHTLTFLK